MNNKYLLMLAAVAASVGFGNAAYAQQYAVSETFASGATFSGIASFDNNQDATTVSGVLTGYDVGTVGYAGSGFSETISWINEPGFNFNNAPIAQNWWQDTSPADVLLGNPVNSILFSIDFTDFFHPVFITTSADLNIINPYTNVSDAMMFGKITAVPEPSVMMLLGAGLAGIGLRVRKQKQLG